MAIDNETVEYNLRLEASQMLSALSDVNAKAGSVPEILKNVENALNSFAKKFGISFGAAQKEMEKTLKIAMQLQELLRNPITAPSVLMNPAARQIARSVSPFEDIGMSTEAGMKAVNDQRRQAATLAQQEVKSEAAVAKEINKTADAQKKLTEESKKTGDTSKKVTQEMKSGFQQVIGHINLLSMAVRILAASLLFSLVNAFQKAFMDASKNARDLEDSLYRLANVERILSEQGVDISMKGLEDGIQRIKKLLPIFSREDISGLVGQIAISTKELGLTEDQIINLSQAIAILNVRSAENETLASTGQKVLSSLLTSNAKGVAALGLSFSKNTMEAKGMEMGILRAGQAVSDLNDQEKGQIKLAIVLENTGKEIDSLSGYLDTNTAKLQQNKAAWNDLLTTIGQGINNLIPNIAPILEKFQQALEVGNIQKLFGKEVGGLGNILKGEQKLVDTSIFYKLYTGVKLTVDEYVRLKEVLASIPKNEILKLFPDPAAIKDRFTRELIESLVGLKDTPTAPPVPSLEVEAGYGDEYVEAVQETEDKVKEIMQEARDKRLDIERDYQEKLQDLARNYSQKLADIAQNNADKVQDAHRDYADKVADINSDTNKSIAEAQAESRKKEVEAEQEYLDKLKDLREQYLMDLEDALHERDARAILRLMRQYEIDKSKAQESRNKEREEAKNDAAQKIADLEQQRKEKLAQAQKDLAEKLRDLKIAAARERRDAAIAYRRQLEDARIAYNRQLEEHRIYLQRKLRDLAAALAAEYNLTAAGQAALTSLLAGASSTTSATATPGPYTSATPTVSSTWAAAGMYGTGGSAGAAEGGTFLATRPSTLNIAENRPEIITATPLGRPGKDVGKVFTDAIGGGGGGQIEIAMTLSPDLEARIVRQSLDETANIVTKINRSKV